MVKPPTAVFVGKDPRGIAVTPDGLLVYVANFSDNTVAIIDATTNHRIDGSGVVVGPGDDCAVLRPSAAPLLVKTDMLLENCHFILEQAGARRVGARYDASARLSLRS